MSTFATSHQAAQPQRSPSHTPSSESSSRDDIMAMISLQAASVRRTFEESDNKRRKNYNSSATAAAAHHMAAISRKRKFETSIAAVTTPLQRNTIFHSAIALCTRPEAKRSRPHGSARSPTSSSNNKIKFPSPGPKVLDGLVLRTGGSSVIQLNYNDVICGKGKTTANLVGNQRFNVWLDLHKESFAKSLNDEDRRRCAEKIVHAIHQSVPSGRFLSLDFLTGVWRDVGNERGVDIVMDALETGVLMDCDRLQLARVPRVRTLYPRVA